MRTLLLLCAVLCFAAHADEISAIKRETNQLVVKYRNRGVLWNLGAGVCLYYNRNRATCGRIEKITDTRMLLRLTDDGAKRLKSGDYIELYANNRVPAALHATAGIPRHDEIDLGIGFTGGFNYFYPNLKFGVALSRQVGLGIEPLYVSFSSGTSSVKAYGGFLTLNYFITQQTFRGLHTTLGVGLYSIALAQNTLTDSASPLAFEGLLQWRGGGHWSLGLDVTFGAGLQYVSTDTTVISTTFKGLLPLFAITVGTTF